MSEPYRIPLDDVKRDIDKAFAGWIASLDDDETDDPKRLYDEVKDLNESQARIMRFFDQVDADRDAQKKLEAEIARLTARCNRMVTTADIKDVEWRPGQ